MNKYLENHFNITEGKSLIIYGPQGSGKTDLANKIAKVLKLQVSETEYTELKGIKAKGFVYTANVLPPTDLTNDFRVIPWLSASDCQKILKEFERWPSDQRKKGIL